MFVKNFSRSARLRLPTSISFLFDMLALVLLGCMFNGGAFDRGGVEFDSVWVKSNKACCVRETVLLCKGSCIDRLYY